MRVAYVEPGKRIVLTGSLGPLLYLRTTGVMDVEVRAAGTEPDTLDYRAAGFSTAVRTRSPRRWTGARRQVTRLQAYHRDGR